MYRASQVQTALFEAPVPNRKKAMSETIDRSELLSLTAEIVSAHVGNIPLPAVTSPA